MFGQFMKMNSASSSGSGTLLSNTITNPKEDLKVERETKVTKDTVPPTNNGSTKDVQPLVVQVETQVPNSKPVVAPAVEPVEALTNMTSYTNSNLKLKNMFGQFMKMITASSSSSETLPRPTIPTTSSSPPKVVKHETEVTKDMLPPTNNRSTKDVQPLVVQIETLVPNSKPVVSPVSAPKPNPKPSIPYPSRLHDQKLRDKANDQKQKIFKIFKDLDFNISFADALILMPKFGPIVNSLLTNKEKLFELARALLNEHCSTILLKKLPEKLGDPGKFLIPRDFPEMDECLSLSDLDASINLMPLSVWNKLYLPELTSTLMTLELADRSISRPIGVAEDVFIKVGKFHFPADFV
nr:reverse transcriptase domain-containing protein [Tanacetum cinerariifolium]